MPLDYPSLAALWLRPRLHGSDVSTASGFVVRYGDDRWLVTNWHVVAGINPLTLESLGASPDTLHVGFRIRTGQTTAAQEPRYVDVPLYDVEGPRWRVHPDHAEKVDLVALPVAAAGGLRSVAYFELHDESPDIFVGCGRPLSIVGFPFGLSGLHTSAVWVQGWVATEPDEYYGYLPRFLVDARARAGQSGSPVLYYDAFGEVVNAQGVRVTTPTAYQALLGVYSGRVNAESDLGVVWNRQALLDIVRGGVRPE